MSPLPGTAKPLICRPVRTAVFDVDTPEDGYGSEEQHHHWNNHQQICNMENDIISYYAFSNERRKETIIIDYYQLLLFMDDKLLVDIVDVVVQGQCNHANDVEDEQCDEDHEVNMIRYTDTIIDPWAMMVESFDAFVTDWAVLRPRRPDNQALRT